MAKTTQEVHYIDNRPLRLQLRRSGRARHLKLAASANVGIEVVMPRWATRRDVTELLGKAEDWVAKQASHYGVWDGPRRRSWATGSELMVLGVPVTLELGVLPPDRRRPTAELTGDSLIMALPTSEVLDPRPALDRWLRRFAGQHLRSRTEVLAEATGLHPKRVMVGERRSRWGSCSSSGTVSYCYRLVMAPSTVVDAVVVHELCHLVHPNHGPRFKNLVRRFHPSHDQDMTWLRDHGSDLEL